MCFIDHLRHIPAHFVRTLRHPAPDLESCGTVPNVNFQGIRRMSRHRVWVATLPPFAGGVPAKTKILVNLLRQRGHHVSVGYYATLTDEPSLSVPSWRMAFGASPRTAARTCFDDVAGTAVGCWLPEFEFTYYLPSPRWQRLIEQHDRHIATGGTSLMSYPFLRAAVPHLVWCASTMIDDRQDRRNAMPSVRRLFDRAIVGPVQAMMERQILAGPGRLMVTSGYTRRRFAAMGRDRDMDLLPIPVDHRRFQPPPSPAPVGVIGFAGRITDPRKNLTLLLDAFALARHRRQDLRLRLTGTPDAALRAAVERRHLNDSVEFVGVLPEADLPEFYRRLDVFVIPSSQEGFGIVGLEALATGVPVISTRCGGPEDFVIPGETGFLTDYDAGEIASRIVEIVDDRQLRQRLSEAGRALAAAKFSIERFVGTFEAACSATWGESL